MHTNETTATSVALTCRSLLKKNGIVDALILETPDLTSFIRIQNVVCFLLDTLNSVFTIDNLLLVDNNIDSCVNFIKSVSKKDMLLICKDVSKITEELIYEGQQFLNQIRTFKKSDIHDITLEIHLPAKAIQIQWLCVSLLEELKNHFLNTNRKMHASKCLSLCFQ